MHSERCRRGRPGLLDLLFLALSACGNAGANGSTDASEDGGDECRTGSLCVPFSWSCDGEGRPVQCSETGDGWIERDPCQPGQACDPETGWCQCGTCETAAGDGCERVGPACSDGWIQGTRCGCEPVVPDCGEDEIPSIAGGCSPVGYRDDCGAGVWGNISTDSTTLFVDGDYTGGASDGSADRPFTSIQGAVDAVPSGTVVPRIIAIAEGRYAEEIAADVPVALRGRCPGMVTVTPPAWSTVGIWLSADGSSIEDLTVDCEGNADVGITLPGPKGITVRNVMIRDTSRGGIVGEGCDLEVVATTITGVSGDSTSTTGRGIDIFRGSSPGSSCALTVRDSDISDILRVGIRTNGCNTTVTGTRVARTGSTGIGVQGIPPEGPSITGNLLEEVSNDGIWIEGQFSHPMAAPVVHANILDGVGADPTFPGPAIAMTYPRDAEVTENVIRNGVGVAILVNNGIRSAIRANYIDGATGTGIIAMSDAGLDPETTLMADNTVRDVIGLGIATDVASVEIARNSISAVAVDPVEGACAAIASSGSASLAVTSNFFTELSGNGIIVREASGDVMLAHNSVDAPLMGISVSDHSGAGSITVEENWLPSPAMGVVLLRNLMDAGRIAGNRIGPLSRTWGTTPDESYVYGVVIYDSGATDLEANYVSFASVAPSEAYTVGVVALDTSLSCEGNRVSGATNTAIAAIATESWSGAGPSITGNVIAGGHGTGIYLGWFAPLDGAEISGNSIASVMGSGDAVMTDGGVFGDGITATGCPTVTPMILQDNTLIGNERTGVFLTESAVASVAYNAISGSDIGVVWREGATVTMIDNAMACNGSNQSLADPGMATQDPPVVTLP